MNNVDVERVDSYLNKNMSEGDRAAFEAELAVNKELASAVALYRSIEDTMRRNEQDKVGEDVLKSTLQALGEVYFASEAGGGLKALPQMPAQPTKYFSFARLAIAASIAVVILSTTFYLLQKRGDASVATGNAQRPNANKIIRGKTIPLDTAIGNATVDNRNLASAEKDTQKTAQRNDGQLPDKAIQKALFTRYFRPDAPPENHDEFLNDAFNNYKKEEYTKAAASFEAVASTPLTRGGAPNESLTIFQAQYYQALSYLAAGNTAKAIARLKKISAPDAFAGGKVAWYLALAYLKEGQSKAAVPLLARLSQDKAARQYRQQAQQLIKALSTPQP